MAKLMSKIGIVSIILFCIVTFAIWATMYSLGDRFFDYESATHSLGQIAGLIGFTLFSLTFVLTTRWKWVEDIFGGLDKVYKTHHLIGAVSFILLLFHPLLLVIKFIPGDWQRAANYLWPSGSWGVNFGIAALLAMIVLLVLTFYVRLKYPTWKLSHKQLGWAFAIAIPHIFLVETDIGNSAALFAWMAVLSAMGLLTFLYASYLKHRLLHQYDYTLEKVLKEGRFTTLHLRARGEPMPFKAGQFAFITFKAKGFKEKHPFTIASKPGNSIRFVIKALGDFTADIGSLQPGTIVHAEGPYGRFDYTASQKPQIWIAGGVGITPFLSFAQDLDDSGFTHRIDLYYCTNDATEQIALEELQAAEKKHANFRIIPFCSVTKGRIDAQSIDKHSRLSGKAVFLCGPPAMMQDLKSQLLKRRIPLSDIHMEDFSFK